jgi:protein CpxP
MSSLETDSRPKRRWLRPTLIAVGIVAVLGGAFGIARAAGVRPTMAFCRGGHGALAHDFIEFRVDRTLKRIGASDAQQRQIMAILDAQFAKHAGMAAVHRQIHQELLAALTGPTVDRAAIEAVRADVVSRLDQGSKDLAQALGDMAEVLTPAQRAQLAQLAQQHFQ